MFCLACACYPLLWQLGYAVHRAHTHRLPIVFQQLRIVALMNTTYFTKICNHKSIKSEIGWLRRAETTRVARAHERHTKTRSQTKMHEIFSRLTVCANVIPAIVFCARDT